MGVFRCLCRVLDLRELRLHGWNAATYLTSELENPQRDLPRILAFGTAIVALLLRCLERDLSSRCPSGAMVGKVEVGYVAAQSVFGPVGATVMGTVLALLFDLDRKCHDPCGPPGAAGRGGGLFSVP